MLNDIANFLRDKCKQVCEWLPGKPIIFMTFHRQVEEQIPEISVSVQKLPKRQAHPTEENTPLTAKPKIS